MNLRIPIRSSIANITKALHVGERHNSISKASQGKKQLFFVIICEEKKLLPEAKTTTTTASLILPKHKTKKFSPISISRGQEANSGPQIELGKAIIICHRHPN